MANLNTIGRILEPPAMKRIRRHMESTETIASMKSAYRELHSTETAMTKVVNDVLTTADNKARSMLLVLYICAAFDTLDHRRVLQRSRELFGLEMNVREWLQPYLTGHKHFVAVRRCRSHAVRIATGMQKGSVLGVLLFFIFTTKVITLISTFRISNHQFTDDV